MYLHLLQAVPFITEFLDTIIASNSIALAFSVVGNVILLRGYTKEKDYNRDRDTSVTKIITLMQSRLEDLKEVNKNIITVQAQQREESVILKSFQEDLRRLRENQNT